jgi:hypothetical protein
MSNNNTNNTCPICFQRCANSQTETLRCSHKFCKQCIETWRTQQSNSGINHRCPLCRANNQSRNRNGGSSGSRAARSSQQSRIAPAVEVPRGHTSSRAAQSRAAQLSPNLIDPALLNLPLSRFIRPATASIRQRPTARRTRNNRPQSSIQFLARPTAASTRRRPNAPRIRNNRPRSSIRRTRDTNEQYTQFLLRTNPLILRSAIHDPVPMPRYR